MRESPLQLRHQISIDDKGVLRPVQFGGDDTRSRLDPDWAKMRDVVNFKQFSRTGAYPSRHFQLLHEAYSELPDCADIVKLLPEMAEGCMHYAVAIESAMKLRCVTSKDHDDFEYHIRMFCTTYIGNGQTFAGYGHQFWNNLSPMFREVSSLRAVCNEGQEAFNKEIGIEILEGERSCP